jgi:hypothetical protein
MAQDDRAICALLDEFTQALYAKNPAAAITPLADDAVTFDLDPPLKHGPDVTHDPARRMVCDLARTDCFRACRPDHRRRRQCGLRLWAATHD